jgi:hypothetical protein
MAKKRRLRAIIDNLQQVTSLDLQNSEQFNALLMKETPEAIADAIKNKLTYATIFEINNTNHYVEIHKRDWQTALEVCLDHYSSEDQEDYEKCVDIKKLIEQINSKKTKHQENA